MNQTSSLRHTDVIITVASWEERFLMGTKRLIDTVRPSRLLMFYYKEYAEWSKDYREQLASFCNDANVTLKPPVPLSFGSPLDSWKALVEYSKKSIVSKEPITLDITTMPREAMWTICYVLGQMQAPLQYVYHKPQRNGYGDWLSRDPGQPRILYRLAGIQHLGRETALVVQTGYDVERVKQLVRYYEPEKVLLGLQTGDQFDNVRQNREKYKSAFNTHRNVEILDVDGYELDGIQDAFVKSTEPLLEHHNVILSSLGPKIGGLALFRVKQRLPDVALSYAPSNEFNQVYSSGIGDCIHGVLANDAET